MADRAPVVYGKYQLLQMLARGGMAEVFKAKSHGVEGFEKILVIKRILPELSVNPQFVEMFINEAKIAVTLSHANIVQVFDLGKADDHYFIAMEYVAGHDLATILERCRRTKKRLPPELAVFIVSEVAKGLDYAHRRRDAGMRALNIVHRDVSPQNVLLSYEGEVKLTDFGIAKARTTVEEDSQSGVLKGKYAYMAPEHANGLEIDARADIFALGTVLYETLAGSNPFLAASSYDTLQRVRAGECRPVRELVPDLPEELSQIVALAMSPDPEARHPNAGRLYEDLIQFLYSSGRRVGAHDLTRFLDALREASDAEITAEDETSLRAAFDEDEAPVVHAAAAATPAEAPHAMTPRAGQETPTGRRQRVTQSLSLPRTERRDVTALAVTMSRNDRTPESTIHALIRRFGGLVVDTVADDAGRAMLVIFGALDPDGRDSEAAARCGLRICRAADAAADEGTETSVRVAIHAGRVLMDLSGEIVREERFTQVVERARHLAATARPGRVLASASAEAAIRPRFALDADGDAFRISGERSVAESYGRFVGRRQELRRVGEILAFANRGRRRVIGVVGEAGTGKTRLLLETMRRLRLGGHDVGMYLASLSRQNREVPLSGVQELLRVVLGIDELDPAPIIRDKVARVRELGLNAAEMAAVEVALGLGGPGAGDATPAGGRPLRAALARIATRLAADRLTVFAFDGAESLDEESQALVDGLLRDARDTRIAVVFAFRPGFVHAWADMPGYHEVEVGPLTDEEVVRLTGSRLGVDEVPLELLRDVTAKSGGNPLYVEEYVKALIDAGAVEVRSGTVEHRPEVAEVEVPKTLRGIVAARVARLGATQRHVLQIASVVGLRFGADVLAAVSEEDVSSVARALSVLEGRGIVLRQTSGEYAFAHDLIPEVLREGLTIEARKELHAAVAGALEALYPHRVDELAERLADHWRKAGNPAKAIDYLVRAADRLENEHALDGAIGDLMRAIDMLGKTAMPDRDRVLSLYRRVGELSFRSRELEEGAERMGAAIEVAEGLGRDEYVARFSMMRGRLLAQASRFQEGRHHLERARHVAKQLGNRELLRDITLATAEADTKNGEYAAAVVLLKEALEISRDTGDMQAQIRCMIPLSLAQAATGDVAAGLATMGAARRLAGINPDRFTECDLLKTESLIHYYARDHKAAIEASGRALELAKEYGFWYEAAVNAHNMGEGYLRLGDYKRAFSNLRYSYELARERGLTRVEHINLRLLGFIDAIRFNSDEGYRRIVEAVEYATSHAYVWDIVQSLYLLALADHHLGRVEEARRGLREVMRLSADHGNTRFLADAEAALRALEAGEPIPLPQ